ETTIKPVEGLTLQGSVSYLNFKFTEIDPNAAQSGITPSTVPPMTPGWKWSGSIAYEFPFANGASITPQFYADYTAGYFPDPVNAADNFVPGRTVLNANITYRSADRDWEFVAG